jgi:hypothetical protein
MLSQDEIGRVLEEAYPRIEAHPGLRAEFAAGRTEFFWGGAPPPGGELRLLEWFVLERPSPTLGGVPVAIWGRAEGGRSFSGSEDVWTALQDSMAGVFEVTSEGMGGTCWVRDLFTLGQHPMAGGMDGSKFRPGDLLVGRVYPEASGTFVASRAAAVFRSPALRAALEKDLADMRRVRRGVLRVQQIELERLFHVALTAERGEASNGRQKAVAKLVLLGLGDDVSTRVVDRVVRGAASGQGDAVTEALNRLAFESSIDLEAAREALLELWEAERAREERLEAPGDAQTALEEFDRGRREGKSLELLFRDLERNLGIEDAQADEDSAGEEDEPVDPPGIVAGLIEEFLWDLARSHGAEHAAQREGLRIFGDYAAGVASTEELGRLHPIDFSARWLLDETDLDAPAASALIGFLAEFCAWLALEHDVDLGPGLDSILGNIREAMPRLTAARVARADVTGEVATVVQSSGAGLEVRLRDGASRLLGGPSGVLPGDVVRLDPNGSQAVRVYPAELALVLGGKRDV